MTPVPTPPSKIVLDRALSVIMLVGSSPLWALISTAIVIDGAVRREDRGGLFHTEVRISAGRPFRLYKFRILKPIGEAEIMAGAIPKHVENNLTNLTVVGRVLKKIGLDELPQLINVMTGRMSLVGPRPKPIPEYIQEIECGNVFRAQLLAGVSGPVQVLKGTVRTSEQSLRADFDYADLMRTGSQWQILRCDIGVLLKTVRVLFRATGE